MPASLFVAGMARSYGCLAISFTDIWFTQKVSASKTQEPTPPLN